MGVQATAMTYVGRYVEDAEAYFIEKGILVEDQAESLFEYDWETAYLRKIIPLQVRDVSCWDDEGYYVGFKVRPSEYKDFDSLITKFKQITGDDADVLSFVHWW